MKPDTKDPEFAEYIHVVMERAPRGIPWPAVLRQSSAYDLFVFKHGFRPAKPRLFDLFFCLFLHANWLHLVGNMLFLWIYGDNVEHRLGSLLYLLAYVGTGVAATLSQMMIMPGSQIPTIGASGAISGVLGFYFVWFPKNRVRVLVVLFPFFLNVILLPARWVLGFYLVFDNLFPLLFGSRASGIAHGAHLGGFVVGALVAYLYEVAGSSVRLRRKLKGRGGAQPVCMAPGIGATDAGGVEDGEKKEASVSLAVRIMDLARQGRYDEAVRLFSEADGKGELPEDDLLSFGELLARRGEVDTALGLFKGYLRRHARTERLPEILLMIGLLYLHGKRQPAYAYTYLTSALERSAEGPVRDQALDALKEIETMQKFRFRGR